MTTRDGDKSSVTIYGRTKVLRRRELDIECERWNELGRVGGSHAEIHSLAECSECEMTNRTLPILGTEVMQDVFRGRNLYLQSKSFQL